MANINDRVDSKFVLITIVNNFYSWIRLFDDWICHMVDARERWFVWKLKLYYYYLLNRQFYLQLKCEPWRNFPRFSNMNGIILVAIQALYNKERSTNFKLENLLLAFIQLISAKKVANRWNQKMTVNW